MRYVSILFLNILALPVDNLFHSFMVSRGNLLFIAFNRSDLSPAPDKVDVSCY